MPRVIEVGTEGGGKFNNRCKGNPFFLAFQSQIAISKAALAHGAIESSLAILLISSTELFSIPLAIKIFNCDSISSTDPAFSFFPGAASPQPVTPSFS